MNTFMPKLLKPYFDEELNLFHNYYSKNEWQDAWFHLERAHVIGQAYPYQHSLVHWKMLLFGVKIKNIKEVIGQIPRLLVGGVKSFVGKIPIGNTGGSNIPPLKSLPIADDIKTILTQAGLN